MISVTLVYVNEELDKAQCPSQAVGRGAAVSDGGVSAPKFIVTAVRKAQLFYCCWTKGFSASLIIGCYHMYLSKRQLRMGAGFHLSKEVKGKKRYDRTVLLELNPGSESVSLLFTNFLHFFSMDRSVFCFLFSFLYIH